MATKNEHAGQTGYPKFKRKRPYVTKPTEEIHHLIGAYPVREFRVISTKKRIK